MQSDVRPLLEQIDRVTRAQEALEASLANVRAINQALGIVAREGGTAAALTVVSDTWVEAFTAEVTRLAASGRPFTSEDVTNIVGRPRGAGENKNNAVGALMMRLARSMHLTRTGRTRISSAPRSRGRLLCEWIASGGDQ